MSKFLSKDGFIEAIWGESHQKHLEIVEQQKNCQRQGDLAAHFHGIRLVTVPLLRAFIGNFGGLAISLAAAKTLDTPLAFMPLGILSAHSLIIAAKETSSYVVASYKANVKY